MNRNRPQSAVLICAYLAGIEMVGDLEGRSSTTRPDHYVSVYLDDKEVLKSEKKLRVPTLQWKWQDQRFWFHPSSTIKIVIYRESRTRIAKHLVGKYTGQIIELLENNATIDLKSKAEAGIISKIKINLSLVSEPEESFMDTIIADIACLDRTIRAPTGILTLGETLQLIKNIMDVIDGAHPILKASWIVMSAAYKAVQQTELLDDTIRDLVENLRETLGVAKEYPDLLVISGTTNIIEEIGRTSLKIASFIHEHTRRSFARRIRNYQLSDDLKSRIVQCLTSCDNLKQRFDRKTGLDTNLIVKEAKDEMDKNNTNIQSTLKTINDDQLVKIRQWLSAPDSSKNYNDAHDKRQRNTCTWFIEGPHFSELQETPDFLWIKGTAGCGKTILCAAIIDKIVKLQKEDASVNFAYFFFDGRSSQTELQLHDKLIRSLIWQLSLQCDSIPAALAELYGRGYQQPSTSSLEDTLQRIINDLPSTYVVIDSLDECTEREKTLRWIEHIISLRMGNLRMVATSRPERDISDSLQLLAPRCVDLVNESENHDITTYLEQQLLLMKEWDEETRKVVQSTLTERAQGMFRWVALQLMELKKCSNHQSVMSQLDSLPKGLYETYDQILSKIKNPTDHMDTMTFLQWLCFSVRPMKLAEIADTIAVDFNTENGPQYTPEHRYWDQCDVMEKCAGLIAESDEGIVKLAHFSIKEYLLSDHLHTSASSFHLTTAERCHALISQTCLAYLLQFDADDSVDSDVAISSPLALYAAENWIFHAKAGGIDGSEPSWTLTLAASLFADGGATFTNWVRIWDLDNPHITMEYREHTNVASPLYYTSLAGLQKVCLRLSKEADINACGGEYGTALQAASSQGYEGIANTLLENGADANMQGGQYGNALQAASIKGHETIVKVLLENGADASMQRGEYSNALQVASILGHQAVVEVLLEKAVDVNIQGGHYGNALQAASYSGYEGIVNVLLKKGADANVQGGYFGTALQAASYSGYVAIVRVLLENGADANIQGGEYSNTLYAASYSGHEAVVKVLLDKGASVNIRGGEYGNALQAASYSGHEGIVKLLLEKGADANAQGGEYGTALQAASYSGQQTIVDMLLKKGADANIQGGKYGNALLAVSIWGHEGIAKLLLEKGADANAQGGEYGNALYAASYSGHEVIVKMLLRNGADVNAQGGKYNNALLAALSSGHKEIVKELLEKGANASVQGGEHGNALQAASCLGDEHVVEVLLENGADANAQGGFYGNALQAASYWRHEVIVKLLLKKGADAKAQGGYFGTTLQAASHSGHEAIVQELLKNGSNVHVNTQGGEYGTALQAASCSGHEAIVKALLEKGADVNVQGGRYGTALQAASHSGSEAIVKLLLAKGADVNAQGGQHGNALQAAAILGHKAVTTLLLEMGAHHSDHTISS